VEDGGEGAEKITGGGFVSEEDKSNFDKQMEIIQSMILEAVRARYSEKVIDEANNPNNVGRMNEPDGCGIITGPCGDTMEFYLKVKEGTIDDISFMTDGCGPTIACGSVTTSRVKGKVVDDARTFTDRDLIDALDGLPEENLHCAKLAIDALREAIKNIGKK